MKKKTIIGFMGDKDACKKAASILQNIGYYKMNVEDKVKEISKYLLKSEDKGEISSEMINDIRNKGYQVNRLYWINLLLSSAPDTKKMIVIEDLRIEDVINEVVRPCCIVSNRNNEDCPKDIEIIEKPKEMSDFKALIESKFKK